MLRFTGPFQRVPGFMHRLSIVCLMPIVLPSSIGAATYYVDAANSTSCPCLAGTAVDPDTNPACGVPSNPFSCISDGVNKAAPGDTVSAAPGTYNECVRIRNKQDVTVQSEVSRGAIIQRNPLHPVCSRIEPDWGRQAAVDISYASNVLFQGFKVTGASASGIQVWATGSDNELDDVEVYGNASGILFYTGNNIVRSSDVHGNAGDGIALAASATDMRLFYVTTTTNGGTGLALYPGADRANVATLTSSFNGGFGVYLASNGNSLNVVTINDNEAEGLYVLGSYNAVVSGSVSRNSRGILVTGSPANNRFSALDVGYSRLYDGVKIEGGFGTWLDNSRIHHGPSNGILEGRATSSIFEYNEIDNNGAKAIPWLGHGLYLGGRSSTIRGNTVHENGGWGIHLWAAPWGTPQNHYVVEHNDVYRNGSGVVLGGSNVYPADPNELPQYTEIRYNTIHHNDDIGFYYLLTTCTGVNNTGNSFHHNTVVDNDAIEGSQIWMTHAYDDQFIFKNNIVVALPGGRALTVVHSNMRANGSDGNLYFRPGSGSSPLFQWNGASFDTLAQLQSSGFPQEQNPDICPLVDPNPGASIPVDVRSTYAAASFLDPTMNRWWPDAFGMPFNGNFHLLPGSAGITGGVCCPETTGGTDIDGEMPAWCPADCVSAGSGVGADVFLDSDLDGMADKYDCLPTQAWNASACDGDLYEASQEIACGPAGAFDWYVHPGAVEICDGKDSDCNGTPLPGGELDEDKDGFFFDDDACSPDRLDCDDADPKKHPDSQELCDGKDNDCDGDVDDLGTVTCGVGACQRTVPVCENAVLQTCTPGSPAPEALTWPGTCFDGLDNDCDGYVDSDCGTDPPAEQGDLVVTGTISSGILQYIAAGSYDDYYEKFDEALVGSDYRLTVVWTFVNPPGGLLQDLVVEGYGTPAQSWTAPYTVDSFRFSRATRSSPPCTANEAWSADILTLTKSSDDDQVVTASTDVTGPVTCIRVTDSVTSADARQDRLVLDRLFLFPTPVASSENGPGPGSVTGTYLLTQKSDDVYETFVEDPAGSPNDLVHTWVFNDVPAGSSHQLNLEGHRSTTGGDNFRFYYSTDNQTFTAIADAEIKRPFEAQGGAYYPFGGSGLSGTVYIRMKDNSPSNSTATTVYLDRLAIKTIP